MRSLRNIVLSPFRRRNLQGLVNGLRVYDRPLRRLYEYTFLRPVDPGLTRVNFGGSTFVFEIASVDDLITIHEIFCCRDYHSPKSAKIIVDFGSNIGISAAFFAASSPAATLYLFEPDPRNLQLLRNNVQQLRNRIYVAECAVTPKTDGEISFGILASGRYGGIGVKSSRSINVPARSVGRVIADILLEHDFIDVLKIDVENLEIEILSAISPDHLRKIATIFVELPIGTEKELQGFKRSLQGQVWTYSKK